MISEVEKICKLWFIFGVHKDGTVDVSDSDRDIIEAIPREKAEKLIEIHNTILTNLETLWAAR